MAQMKRLLVIEDDLSLTLALYRALSHTYKVDTAKTAVSGIKKAESLPINLIILDLNLPDHPGIKVMRRLRDNGANTPILVLSGESSLACKIDAFENGANDYVTKPFSLAELKARITVLLRQTVYPIRSALVVDDLVLEPRTRQVIRDGVAIDLRRKEFALLECLLCNAGTVLTRTYLMDTVWGRDTRLRTNAIDVHIKSLRDKIDRGQKRQLIRTVHGLGYVLDVAKPRVRVD